MPPVLRTLAMVLTVATIATVPVRAEPQSEWRPETFTLSNGLRVVVLPDHRAPVVTHMIWYHVGSSAETPGKTGLAHFLEHLMFKATTTRPAGEYSREIARNGGQDNAATSYDFTNYHFRIASDRLPEMMRMEADRMINLDLAENEVIPERQVVQEERRQNVESNPAAILEEMMAAKVYEGHPYAEPVIGRMDEVAKLTRADAVGWYRTWYAPENAVVVVSGDITAGELKPLAEKVYGQIPRRGPTRLHQLPKLAPLKACAEVTYRDAKVQQPSWSRSWQGAPMGHPDAAALRLGMQVLGGGRTSRLYRELVEGGKAVVAYGYVSELEAAGSLNITITAFPGVTAEQLRDETVRIISDLIANGPTESELALARKSIAVEEIYRRDNQMNTAQWYGNMVVAGMSLDQIAAEDAKIATISPEEVRSAMRRYLSANHVDGFLLPVVK